MICPVCGSTGYREARQCPAYDGQPVCISCCYSCEYLSTDRVICRYRAENASKYIDDELSTLRRRAILKKKQADYLWEHGKNFAAYKVEEEWRACLCRIKELEEQKNEKRV